jgi:hypothetical protein
VWIVVSSSASSSRTRARPSCSAAWRSAAQAGAASAIAPSRSVSADASASRRTSASRLVEATRSRAFETAAGAGSRLPRGGRGRGLPVGVLGGFEILLGGPAGGRLGDTVGQPVGLCEPGDRVGRRGVGITVDARDGIGQRQGSSRLIARPPRSWTSRTTRKPARRRRLTSSLLVGRGCGVPVPPRPMLRWPMGRSGAGGGGAEP